MFIGSRGHWYESIYRRLALEVEVWACRTHHITHWMALIRIYGLGDMITCCSVLGVYWVSVLASYLKHAPGWPFYLTSWFPNDCEVLLVNFETKSIGVFPQRDQISVFFHCWIYLHDSKFQPTWGLMLHRVNTFSCSYLHMWKISKSGLIHPKHTIHSSNFQLVDELERKLLKTWKTHTTAISKK